MAAIRIEGASGTFTASDGGAWIMTAVGTVAIDGTNITITQVPHAVNEGEVVTTAASSAAHIDTTPFRPGNK